METFNIDKIEEILPRYCSGEATIEECRMVEEWIGQSEDNYRIVKQMYAIDQAMGTVRMESQVNTERALASVNRKMSKEHSLVNWFTWVQRVAAILFVPLLIIWGIEHITPRTEIARMIEIKTNPGMTRPQRFHDKIAVEMTAAFRVDLHSLSSGGGYTLGVVVRLEIAFDNGHAELGGKIRKRPFE